MAGLRAERSPGRLRARGLERTGCRRVCRGGWFRHLRRGRSYAVEANEGTSEELEEEGEEDQPDEREGSDTRKLGQEVAPWLRRLLSMDEDGIEEVPWGASTIVTVMTAWIVCFFLVGHYVLPAIAALTGVGGSASGPRCLAVYSLAADAMEMAVGLAVLKKRLAPFRDAASRWLRVRLRGPWIKDVAVALLFFPVVSSLSTVNQEVVAPVQPFANHVVGPSPWDHATATADRVANAIYLLVLCGIAPVWEETIFRGFFLPSLAKYFPVDACLGLSSLTFALAHMSAGQILPLWLLGVLMGIVFWRSRNLLAPIVLHSAWNCLAFFDLV